MKLMGSEKRAYRGIAMKPRGSERRPDHKELGRYPRLRKRSQAREACNESSALCGGNAPHLQPASAGR